MAGRQILLVIDGFFGYHAGLNLFYKEYLQGLSNANIVFLPSNATFIYQSLD